MKVHLKQLTLIAALIFSVNLCNAAFPINEQPAPAISQELLNNNIKDGIIEADYISGSHYSPAAPQPAPVAQQQKGSGFAIASLACAVTGLFVAGIPLGIAGIVFGVLGMSGDRPLKGLAIAGLIIGIVDVVVVAAYLSTL